ncbi:MAG: o-succinylbenzoate synthase [Chlorobi bacterium CHB1]|nr:o-succinylbenzoate synthase [Chlorobi bacterium CHB1]
MQIERLTLREIRLPLKEPFEISSGTVTDRRIFLLQLRDVNGVTGWGECVAGEAPNYSAETVETAWLAIREWIAPRVLGRTFHHPREIFPVLEENFRGHNMAKAAVEMGAWELAAQIQACRAQGYRKIKVKIKPGADVAFVAAVREALGPEAPMMVDANNAFSLNDIDLLKKLDAFDLIMIEQPLAWDDIVRHAALQKQLKTPICLDESITGLDKAEDMLALGSGRIINIKPGRVGGFTASIAIHDFCAKNGIPVWCGGMLESGIGRAHNVALASLPNFVLPGDLSPSSRYWERDIVTPEWTMDAEGMVTVPLDKPGMGVTVNLDRVDELTVRCEAIAATRSK